MHVDVGLCCMSCDARMHVVANGTIESAVMRMGEELGCLTVFLIALLETLARAQSWFLTTSSQLNWRDSVYRRALQGMYHLSCVVHTIIVPRLLL
jgi:hypothetical protein